MVTIKFHKAKFDCSWQKYGPETVVNWPTPSVVSFISDRSLVNIFGGYVQLNQIFLLDLARKLAEKCGYLAKQGSFANIGTKKIVNEFKPIIKQGLSRENLLKMYSILEPYNSEIQEISSCMEQQMEMAPSDGNGLAVSLSVVPHVSGKYMFYEFLIT